MLPSDNPGGAVPPLFDDIMAEMIPKYPFDPDGETKAAKQRRWEHRVVGLILSHYNLLRHAPEMTALTKDQLGHARLTFEAFRYFQPSFPIWLSAMKVPNVHKTTLEEFARGFTKTDLYDKFSLAEADTPEVFHGGRTGLVFEWLKVFPVAIIHNHYHAISRQELVLFYHFPKLDQLMAIQSLGSFLDALPWTPNDNPPRLGY